MNNPNKTLGKEEENSDQGFTRLPSRKRGGRKQDNQEVNKKISISNKFEALDDLSEETFEKQSEHKQGDHAQMETMEIASPMGEEATKGNNKRLGIGKQEKKQRIWI